MPQETPSRKIMLAIKHNVHFKTLACGLGTKYSVKHNISKMDPEFQDTGYRKLVFGQFCCAHAQKKKNHTVIEFVELKGTYILRKAL